MMTTVSAESSALLLNGTAKEAAATSRPARILMNFLALFSGICFSQASAPARVWSFFVLVGVCIVPQAVFFYKWWVYTISISSTVLWIANMAYCVFLARACYSLRAASLLVGDCTIGQANWALVLYTMASSVWFVCFDVACASRDGAADSRNAPSTAASFTPYFEVAGFPFIGGPAVCCTVAAAMLLSAATKQKDVRAVIELAHARLQVASPALQLVVLVSLVDLSWLASMALDVQRNSTPALTANNLLCDAFVVPNFSMLAVVAVYCARLTASLMRLPVKYVEHLECVQPGAPASNFGQYLDFLVTQRLLEVDVFGVCVNYSNLARVIATVWLIAVSMLSIAVRYL